MRFAHLSDTHLGYRQYSIEEREVDFYAAFREAVDKIIEANCDFVLHCGDLFDEPRPHIKAMLEVRDAIDKLEKAGIDFYAITGNHDRMVRRGSYPPHNLYKGMNLLTIEEPIVERDDVLICGLPYIPRSYVNVLRDKLDEIYENAEGHENSILMLHQGVDKYIGFETAYELKIGDIPKGFDYYAMGHIHLRRIDKFRDGKLAYPGSTEVWRIDELDDFMENGKGFYIVDERFEIQKVDIECIRPQISDVVESEEDIGRIKKGLSKKRRPVLHLQVTSKMGEYVEMYQRLVEEFNELTLYLDLKRMPVDEEVETFVGEEVSVEKLLSEVLRNRNKSEEETGFAYSLFEALSRREIENAAEIAEEFFKTWSEGETGRLQPAVHEEGGEYKTGDDDAVEGNTQTIGQSNLEAYR